MAGMRPHKDSRQTLDAVSPAPCASSNACAASAANGLTACSTEWCPPIGDGCCLPLAITLCGGGGGGWGACTPCADAPAPGSMPTCAAAAAVLPAACTAACCECGSCWEALAAVPWDTPCSSIRRRPRCLGDSCRRAPLRCAAVRPCSAASCSAACSADGVRLPPSDRPYLSIQVEEMSTD